MYKKSEISGLSIVEFENFVIFSIKMSLRDDKGTYLGQLRKGDRVFKVVIIPYGYQNLSSFDRKFRVEQFFRLLRQLEETLLAVYVVPARVTPKVFFFCNFFSFFPTQVSY